MLYSGKLFVMKTIIHVNQHNIKYNIKNKNKKPVLTVKTYKSNRYCNQVVVLGESKIIYSPDKPLSCGARVWIETESPVIVVDEMSNVSEESLCKLKKIDKKSKRI